MIKTLISKIFALIFISVFFITDSNGQNSILVNFGTSSCAGSAEPAFSLIKNPLTDSASSLTSCSLVNQLPNIFGVFIAYNPKENNMYVADIRSGITKIWRLNIGLPVNVNCPLLDTLPDYSYNYVSNNFEFDNNGNLWSFSNYVDSLGQCNVDNFDVNTGNIISSRIIQFPQGFFPESISSGDITILPNGRMFATLGSLPSRLYEIKNYNSTTNAYAIFLDSLPQSCYGIAYLNGQLELTGSDFSGNCYYYIYNIPNNTLDSAKSFQIGQLPIDNTSITPSLGLAKQLIGMTKVDEHTADLVYEIYAENLGNVALNNINISDNLSSVYGAQNISNIQVVFTSDGNSTNLQLNSKYNGSTDTLLLAPDQHLPNNTDNNNNYFTKLRISVRVSNLSESKIYQNSAIGMASIGTIGTLGYSDVKDSSNNGPANSVDPNNDGNATEPGENTPTLFNFGALPVQFISINASALNESSVLIKWNVATPLVRSDKFEIQYSNDEIKWITFGTIEINNISQSNYSFIHHEIFGDKLFYRVEETDNTEKSVFSPVVLFVNKNKAVFVYPNPANDLLQISYPIDTKANCSAILYDVLGNKFLDQKIISGNNIISTKEIPSGLYLLKIINGSAVTTRKIIIRH